MQDTITEKITHDQGDDGAWVCICGNEPSQDGFYPCDDDGNEVDPVIGSDWDNLYVCFNCGRIIDQDTLEVVGRNQNPKMLD